MSNVKRLLILGIAAGLAFSVMGNTAAGFNLGKVLNKVGVSTTESSEEPLYEGEPADGTREMVWFIMQKSMAGMMRKQEPFFREMMLKRAECRRSRADYGEMRFNLWYCESGTGRFRGASGK